MSVHPDVPASVATDALATAGVAGLAMGGALFLGVLVGFPISGGSLNPARSFGPALVSGVWRGFWVYLFAPIIGGTAGGLACRYLKSPAEAWAQRPHFGSGPAHRPGPGGGGIEVPT